MDTVQIKRENTRVHCDALIPPASPEESQNWVCVLPSKRVLLKPSACTKRSKNIIKIKMRTAGKAAELITTAIAIHLAAGCLGDRNPSKWLLWRVSLNSHHSWSTFPSAIAFHLYPCLNKFYSLFKALFALLPPWSPPWLIPPLSSSSIMELPLHPTLSSSALPMCVTVIKQLE